MIFLLWLLPGCFCVQPSPPPQSITKSLPTDLVVERFSGTIDAGKYRDSHFSLHGDIPENWDASFGFEFELKRVIFSHRDSNTKVEIWRFPYPMIEPSPLDFCTWTFIDVGLYGVTKSTDPRVVSTCFPDSQGYPIVYGILRHRKESTWQFEIHTSAKNMTSSKRIGEELLMNLYWSDDGEPVYKRKQ